MANYFILVLPVYGQIGNNTIWDRTVDPPKVTKLHYVFDYFPESSLFQTFPIFIASQDLADSLSAAAFSGIVFDKMEISASADFSKLYPGKFPPADHLLLRVQGLPLEHDFAQTQRPRLVVSKRALDFLEKHGVRDFLKYDAENPPTSKQIEDDLFQATKDAFRKGGAH